MAVCSNAGHIVAAASAALNDQHRRHILMLGLWVSEIEPELGYDAIYAPGASRSTVHYGGPKGVYSFRQSGPFRSGYIKANT